MVIKVRKVLTFVCSNNSPETQRDFLRAANIQIFYHSGGFTGVFIL